MAFFVAAFPPLFPLPSVPYISFFDRPSTLAFPPPPPSVRVCLFSAKGRGEVPLLFVSHFRPFLFLPPSLPGKKVSSLSAHKKGERRGLNICLKRKATYFRTFCRTVRTAPDKRVKRGVVIVILHLVSPRIRIFFREDAPILYAQVFSEKKKFRAFHTGGEI